MGLTIVVGVVGVTLPQGKACDDKVWFCLYSTVLYRL